MPAESAPDLCDPKDKLILIVDDDDSQRELMVHIARREGFRTDEAKTGVEVLYKITITTPDLILLDLILPGRDGYEVLRELQGVGMGGIPVIVVTGRSLDRKTIETVRLEANVCGFVEKPFHHQILGAALHVALKTRTRGLAK